MLNEISHNIQVFCNSLRASYVCGTNERILIQRGTCISHTMLLSSCNFSPYRSSINPTGRFVTA